MNDWDVDNRMPKYNDINDFEVWVDGYVRRVHRVGNHSTYFTPGTLVFIDCKYPMQNAICHEPMVKGWRVFAETVAETVAETMRKRSVG